MFKYIYISFSLALSLSSYLYLYMYEYTYTSVCMYIHEYIHIYIYTYHQNVREFALGLPILFKRVDTDFAILCNVRVEDRRDEKALGRGCREIRTKDELHSEAASLKRCLSCVSKKPKSNKNFEGATALLPQNVSQLCVQKKKATTNLMGYCTHRNQGR